MKVIMVLGRSTGGVGTHVAQLSADLRDSGVDVMVVTHPLTAEHFDLRPVRLLWPGSAGLVEALRDFRQLRRLVAAADIVHAHGHQGGLLATLSTLGMRRAVASGLGRGVVLSLRRAVAMRNRRGGAGPRRAAPKLVVSHHNAVLEGSGREALKRLSQRWVARRADLVTGASSDLVSEALAFGARRAELADVPSPRVPQLLAQPPADGAARARLRQDLLSSLGQAGRKLETPEVPLVVTISRIAPQKNLPILVQAVSRLRQSCTWVVLGGGEPQLLAQLQAQASALAAPIHFVGPRSEVEPWLRAAEVFVLPSQWEARALVVQEAMAAGTPVVASDVGGLHDLVAGTGLLVPAADPGAIAMAVDRILADAALREQLAEGGRVAARALPDGYDTASRWLRWYSETLLIP